MFIEPIKIGKVKFWSKMAIRAIRAKSFSHIISDYMILNFKQKIVVLLKINS
jgi:hypothetical protein